MKAKAQTERTTSFTHEVNLGADYTEEEVEWLTAVERWKSETHTRFPTCCQLLAIAKSLGYRRVERRVQLDRRHRYEA